MTTTLEEPTLSVDQSLGNQTASEPEAGDSLKILIRSHLAANRHEEARSLCRRILADRPDDAEAMRLLDQCKFDLEEFTAELPELPQISGSFLGTEHVQLPSLSARHIQSPSHAEGLFGDYATRCQSWADLGPEHLLRQLVHDSGNESIRLKSTRAQTKLGKDGWPLPPVELTMGYGAGDLDHYMECGRRSHAILSSILSEQNLWLTEGNAVLDWGCAAGRVVRTFARETERGCQVWGCDIDTASIEWAQNHLSPPFRFFNCTSFPRLPFPDNTFNFIYGLSVFTHLVVFRDMWLLELARVLKPGACAVMTVHDEQCWKHFQTSGMPPWVPEGLRHHQELPAECVEIRGGRWDQCYTFFHSAYLHRVWGRFLEIVDIKPLADSYQAAVVLRKPWSSSHVCP